ncbi:MAG: transcriptional repressor LexA [bacterium]
MKEEQFSTKELEAIRHIRNWFMHHSKMPSVRQLMKALEYKSPRSAVLIMEGLIDKGILKKWPTGGLQFVKDIETNTVNARTVNVPIVGTVACGLPILAEENIEAYIPVSISIARPGHKYFLLLAKGDSMDEAGINDKDLVLVKQQPTAENGDKVVALIDDEATVKEFCRTKDAVILRPRSTNKKHQPIILTDNFQIQGVVITTIPNMGG